MWQPVYKHLKESRVVMEVARMRSADGGPPSQLEADLKSAAACMKEVATEIRLGENNREQLVEN